MLMNSFKDFLEYDNDVFINSEEFAETHTVNGKEMDIVVDDDLSKERNNKTTDSQGLYTSEKTLFIKKDDYGEKPVIYGTLNLDGDIYTISDVEDDGSMYIIDLVANES